jgi:hypothetical protein
LLAERAGALRLKEDALRLKEDALRLKEDALRLKEDALRLKEDALRLKEDARRLKEVSALRLKHQTPAHNKREQGLHQARPSLPSTCPLSVVRPRCPLHSCRAKMIRRLLKKVSAAQFSQPLLLRTPPSTVVFAQLLGVAGRGAEDATSMLVVFLK